MDEPTGLEVAQIDYKTAGDAFRLAAKTLFADWRADPTVETMVAQRVLVSAIRSIPAILDGEPVELGHVAEVRFLPVSFRALAPHRASSPRTAPTLMGEVLQLSDVHFSAENKPAVAAALAYAQAAKPDLVLVSGDITQAGRTREFEAAAAWIAAMPEPVFVIPGNHDTPYWDLIARLAWPWRRYEQIIKHPAVDHQFQTERLAVRGVNTARAAQMRWNWSKGADRSPTRTRRAARALSEAPAQALRIIACHHPLIEMEGTPMTGDVRCGDAAAEIFAAAGVDLVVTGHVHVPFALEIPIGDRRSHAVGSGTLSLRLRGAPASFNQIDWDDGEISITAMYWAGEAFTPGQTWRYKRRQNA